MESFRSFVDIFIPLMLIVYGFLFVIDPERYFPHLAPLVATAIGGVLIGIGLWVYMRNKDD